MCLCVCLYAACTWVYYELEEGVGYPEVGASRNVTLQETDQIKELVMGYKN